MNRDIHCLIASNKHKLCPKIEAIDFYAKRIDREIGSVSMVDGKQTSE